MRLEDIVAEVRPREPREAQDLGFTLARLWLKQLLLIQLLAALPYLGLAIALGLWVHPLIGLILFLWFRPIMDRWGLAYVSQAMFGHPPTIRQLASSQFSKLFTYFLYGFLIDRLDMKRSMMMPVAYLEGVKGDRLRRRRKVVAEYGGEVGGVLSMWFGVFALLLTWSIFILSFLMLPRGMEIPIEDMFVQVFESRENEHMTVWWIYSSVWALVLLFLSPFYICAGFVLYLNSRSHQEGWDIEIVFRKLAQRLEKTDHKTHQKTSGMSAVILVSLFTLFGGGANSYAGQQDFAPVSSDDPGKVIEQVLKTETFQRHERVVRRLKSSNQNTGGNNTTSLGIGLGNMLKALAIGTLLLMVLYLAYLVLMRLKESQKHGPQLATSRERIEPKVSQTKLIAPLPANIPEKALMLWQDNQKLEAMSMLYRGMLDALSIQFQLRFSSGETEYECRRHIRSLAHRPVVSYCEKLLRTWLDYRYAGRMPSHEVVVGLCRNWPFRQQNDIREGAKSDA